MKPLHIIGVPLDLGGGRRGVDMGPSAVRIAGLGEQLAAMGHVVLDKGDLATPIPETHVAGALPITLGGDHSLAVGSVGASADFLARRGSLGLIWVDAHGDMNT